MQLTPIPGQVLAYGARGADWQRWVDALPGLRRDLLDEWGLDLDGAAMHGQCAIIDPVRTGDGQAAVLKLSWPHWEADHEHLALRHWAGHSAVRLLRADPRRYALLLERADAGRDLNSVPALEACQTVAALYHRIHMPATPALRKLSDQTTRWSRELRAMSANAPLPRRLVGEAAGLAADLGADPACDGRLIHTDLHYGNVLAATREPWLVIDPKPLSGDPHYEVAPLLWNRWGELAATGDVRAAIRTRFHSTVDAALLDEDRARDWVVVRALVNAKEMLNGGGPASSVRDYLTGCVTMAKAVRG